MKRMEVIAMDSAKREAQAEQETTEALLAEGRVFRPLPQLVVFSGSHRRAAHAGL